MNMTIFIMPTSTRMDTVYEVEFSRLAEKCCGLKGTWEYMYFSTIVKLTLAIDPVKTEFRKESGVHFQKNICVKLSEVTT